MRRADRLFEIIQMLRQAPPDNGRMMAEWMALRKDRPDSDGHRPRPRQGPAPDLI